jgi:hypothetical protein
MTGSVTSSAGTCAIPRTSDQREHPCKRNAGDQHHQANDDGLDEGHPEDALCDRTNGGGGQLRKLFAPARAGDAIENGPGASGARLAEGHDDPSNDE